MRNTIRDNVSVVREIKSKMLRGQSNAKTVPRGDFDLNNYLLHATHLRSAPKLVRIIPLGHSSRPNISSILCILFTELERS